MQPLVLDTNVVLDAFVFDDEDAQPLQPALESGRLQWLATAAMREELARVLGYPRIVPRLAFYGLDAAQVLAHFDRFAHVVDEPDKAPATCADPDDQKFIDLAVARGALLLSRDAAVLSMKNRLARLDVAVRAALGPQPSPVP
ncbi:PIN domain-containing protein [Ramlibacter sp. MMS24-I3-19]|uniref:PIN domain-containing protein n=1 Tax=Ramlibacter sp. MMS24-I3-19 TaxID=3416606 RepID=UPI003D01AE30